MSMKKVFLIKEDIYHQHWTSDGYRYNVGMLYDYAKSVADPEQIPIDSLKRGFEKTNVDEEKWSKDFIDRCYKTDMKYPILVVRDNKKKLWIADGNHRYGKAVMHAQEMIMAYIVDEKDLPEKAIEPKPSDDDTGSHKQYKSNTSD